MPTYNELANAALSRYDSGDIEGAKRLKKQALAQQQYDTLEQQAFSAFDSGDVETAKDLKAQALETIAPYKTSTFTDVGRGVLVAPVTVAQGISEMAALGLDFSLGTEYSRPVTEAFEGFKREYDLDPKTAAGEVTEELLGFGLGFIPIAGWLGRASSVAKVGSKTSALKKGRATSKFFKSAERFGDSAAGRKLLKSRAGLIGSTALATAGYETIVTPDGRATMADAFDVVPFLQTVDTSEMQGSDLLYNRLSNKLRRGIEGGLASLTFDVGLPVLGAGARALGTVPVVSEVASATARASSTIFKTVTEQIGKIPGAGTAKNFFKAQLTATGMKFAPLFEEILDVDAVGATAQRTALNFYKDFEDATGQFMTVIDAPKLSKKKRAQIDKDMYQFLTVANSNALDGYKPAVKKSAQRLLKLDLDYQDKIFKELEERVAANPNNLDLKRALKDVAEHKASTAGFLRRRFRQYDDSGNFFKELDLEGPAFKAAYKEVRATLESKNLPIRPSTPVQKLQKSKGPALSEKQKAELSDANRIAAETNENLLRSLQSQKAALPLGSDTTLLDDAIQAAQREKARVQKPGPISNTVVLQKVPYTSEELDQIATDKLYEYIGLSGAKDLPEAKKMLTELQKKNDQGKRELINEGRTVDIADNMFIERIEDLDQMPALLALKGEIVDPKRVYINTISDMANTLAGLNFYKNAAGTFGTDMQSALAKIDKGELPSIIKEFKQTSGNSAYPTVSQARSGVDLPLGKVIKNTDERLRNLGYVRLGADESGEISGGGFQGFGGKFADLTGAYVRPEVKEALTTPARMGLDGMGQAAAIGATLKGQAQRMAIVPNIVSQVRNIYGNLMYLAGNGNLGRDSDFVDTFRLIAANVEHMDDAGFKKFADELGALGVMDTSLVTSALREYKDFAQKFSVSGKVSNVFEGATRAIPFMRQFEAMYSDSDSFFKLMAVFAEQSKMANALGKAGLDINDAMSLPVGFRAELAQNLMDAGLAKRAGSLTQENSANNLLLTMAGDTVKDTMPVYTRIGKAIRQLDAIPIFGNFTSFASENIRNSYNTMNRGMKELAFKASDKLIEKIGKEKATILERQIRGMGSQRLMSFLAVSAATPAAVTKASMLATGTSQEEMDAAESQVADFYQGHALGVISNDKRGNIQLFDQSFVNPYGFVRDPIINALRTYERKGELNASEVEQLTAASWAGVTGYLEPFGSESIIFERARDVLPSSWLGRGGETQTGSRVYQDGESLGEKVSQGVAHILGAYIPGYGRMFAEERGGKLEYGRLTRGVAGIPGSRGQEYTGKEELARALTGFTPITLNLRTDFGFKGGEYLPLRSSAKSVATRAIKSADSTVEEMTGAWDTYLDNLYREQSKLYYNVQQARKLNASDTVLRQQLKSSGLGTAEIAAIMRGEFWPGLATKELIIEVRKDMRNEDRAPRVVKDIPFGEFNQRSNEVRNRPLSPQIAVQEREARLEARDARRTQEMDAAMANTIPVEEPEVQVPVQQVAPQPQPQSPAPQSTQSFFDTATSAVSGEVSDLYDRAREAVPSLFGDRRNQEIIDRSNRAGQ
tara:strand:- start:245 stop:4951 length:4707 start_codon:yes stop_codon:yes gene_type:complete